MNFVCILLLIGLSAAARCDKFVTGLVWIHEIAGEETSTTYQGCKKGCFNNGTTNDDGSQKCEKCSIIEEEKLCVQNALTCQWKSGKCVSQSCPQMAKETNTRHALYKECVEGSPKEQAFNNDYWNDYKNNYNGAVSVPGTDPNFALFINRNICEDRITSIVCRELPETTKNKCYFLAQTAWDNAVSQKNRTERCLTEPYGPLLSGVGSITNLNGAAGEQSLVSNQTKFKLLYGFSTAVEVCNDEISRALKNCDDDYINSVTTCQTSPTYNTPRTPKNLNHIGTKRARTMCHLVYGCMYSKDNERCSVWAVWAFVLALVLSIVVVVVVIIVVVIVLIPKRRKVESA